ncbi:MAG TPA: ACT domain-containing protein [Candidatus Acidoferrales bacterium]|nr:ACT domain-containing protein [Candidatus Acidoferrales bacterium]
MTQDEKGQERLVITVTGSDHPGIIAAVTGLFARFDANIEDLSQTVVAGLFTMIMIVSIGDANFDELKKALENVGATQGVRVTVQHEDIFRYMHRI